MIFGKIHIKDLSRLKYNNIKYFEIDDSFIPDPHMINIYVGFNNIKDCFGEDIILNYKIDDNNYWMFSYDEKIQFFNEDLPKLLDNIINRKIEKTEYIFIDPIIDELYTSKDINYIIPNNIKSLKIENMIYFIHDEIIYGLNLDYLKKLSFDINQIINNIKEKSICFVDNKEVLTPDINLPIKYYTLFL